MLLEKKLLLCDLTQSWSETGGGIGTYLREKRRFIEHNTEHDHLLIVPGPEDRIRQTGRLTIAEIRGPRMPGAPNYRLLLRNRAVGRLLEQLKPDFVESLDPYNLPWAAIRYRRVNPRATLIAGYRTDFPNAHVGSLVERWCGSKLGRTARDWSYRYAGKLYDRFDGVYALNAQSKAVLEANGTSEVSLLSLGVDVENFSPRHRNIEFRRALGVGPEDSLLVYAGRLDGEKRVMAVFEAFKRLPRSMNAHLLLLGEGKYRNKLLKCADGLPVHIPGYESDRSRLATALASSDIYVSAMPYETFGISIVEAQASGLPIVGVAAGAMTDRVQKGTGLLGPMDDPDSMANNIVQIWRTGAALSGERGRQLVQNEFSWLRTFRTLFSTIYAKAHARRVEENLSFQPATACAREVV